MMFMFFFQVTIAISNIFMYTLYDNVKDKVDLIVFINNRLRNFTTLKSELNDSYIKNLDRIDVSSEILERIHEQFGKVSFDTSLYDLYFTSYSKIPVSITDLNLFFKYNGTIKSHKKCIENWSCKENGSLTLADKWLNFLLIFNSVMEFDEKLIKLHKDVSAVKNKGDRDILMFKKKNLHTLFDDIKKICNKWADKYNKSGESGDFYSFEIEVKKKMKNLKERYSFYIINIFVKS